MKKTYLFVLLLLMTFTAWDQGYWKRIHGDGISEVPSAEGTYSPTNSPFSRYATACMIDSSGTFWLYGGGTNDLWRFDPEINQWMIVDGDYDGVGEAAVYGTMGIPDELNNPGTATFGHPSWGDHEGNVWLYGVNGLNDMWKYDISTEMWTWVKGTASPGPPVYGVKGVESPTTNPGTCNETDCHWTDSEGKLWLYTEMDGNLWIFDTDTEMWTWMAGNGVADAAPEYGTLDEFDEDNTPGGFSACPAVGTLYSMWITSDDHLWMLVNRFEADLQTEVWEFDPELVQWRCRRIDISEFAELQVYPEECTENETIFPIARTEMRADWVDDCDHLYMFGGMNYCMTTQAYNDVWMYDPATNNFTYLKGGTGPMVPGIQGVFDADNLPGTTAGSQAWQNENGFYMMGGQDALGADIGNSVWIYLPDTVVADFSFETDCNEVVFSNLSETGCNSFKEFHWSFGDGNTSELENPEHAYATNGTYEVMLIATNCSWHSDTITYSVEIDCGFSIEMESDTICEGDCIELVVTSTEDTDLITFEWDNDITEDNDTVLVCPDVTTTYQVIGSTLEGMVDTAWATITVIPEPIVDLGPDTVICEGELILDAGNPDASFLWNDASTEQFLTVNESGVYSVQVMIGSCIVVDSINVLFFDTSVDLGPDLFVCHIDTVYNAGEGDTYLWQDGSTSQLYTVNDTGLYFVTITNDLGCESSDTVTIYPGTITIDLGEDTVFCGDVDWELDAGYPGAVYSWDDGSEEQIRPVSDSGLYFITVVDGYCEATDSIHIAKRDLVAEFSVSDTTGCVPLTTVFTDLSDAADIVSWYWTFGDGGTSTVQHPTYEYSVTGIYEVDLQITDGYGCVSDASRTVEIEVYPQPEASFSFSPEPPEVNGEVSFIDESIDANAWYWTFGDGFDSEEQHPKHTYTYLSDFLVTLVVANNECTDSISKRIVLVEDLIFYVPNVFTPDGDSFNEAFTPVFTSGYDPYNYHLTIFNRWGEIIFESFDTSKGWDGTYGNRAIVQDGVYVWKIEFGDANNDKRYTYKGHVSVLQ